jgi:hypothetical protein
MYQLSLMAKQREYAVLKYAEERGEKRGVKKGKRSEAEKIIRGVLALKAVSISQISEATGWSEQAIQKLKDSMKLDT